MLDPFYIFGACNLVMACVVLYLALSVRKLRSFVGRLSVEKGKVIDPKLVAIWKQRLRENPEGSPKHNAYKKRLEEIGYGD